MYEPSPRWTDKNSKLPQLPKVSENQRFTAQYFKRDEVLTYDEKVMEEVDDLSDTDKVSLLSDLELETASNDGSSAKEKLGELNLNLKNISKLNTDQVNVKRKNNGVELSRGKQKCGHTKSCASCYELPLSQEVANVSNQEQLIEVLKHPERLRPEAKSGSRAGKDFAEDTVSEEEYGTSDEESTNKSKSKYTHSRFSSQIDAELDELMPSGALNDIDIDQLDDIQIGSAHKILHNDPRNLLKKKNLPVVQAENFNENIDSIQNRGNAPLIAGDSPALNRKKPKVSIPAVFDDSMVVMGSKSLEKGLKKKGKGIKLGGTNNLKKNKLAIAFNNLEMEHANRDKDEQSQDPEDTD